MMNRSQHRRSNRRSQRARLLLTVLAVCFLTVAPAVDPAQAAGPVVTTDPLQALFWDYGDAAQGDRWTGSDGAYDVALPDGRRIWMWGDTYLGRVNPDHSRDTQGFLHHAFTIQNADGALGETVYKHNDGFGDRAIIPTADGQTYYWLGDGTVEGNKYRQFVYRIVGGFIAGVDIATFALPAFTYEGLTSMPGAYVPGEGTPMEFGVSIVEEDDYTYVYGCESEVVDKFLHVARVPKGHLLDGQWEYWNGTSWSTVAIGSARIRSGVADEMSVVKTRSGYRAVATFVGITNQIFMYTAPAPQGPWSAGTLLYTTPESNSETITYNAKEHPDFDGPDHIVISYNVNTQTGNTAGQYSDVDNYRPRWIRVAVPSDLAATAATAPDSYTVGQERVLDVPAPGVLANDTRGTAATASLTAAPAHGTATLRPDGSFSYVPVDGFVGTDSIGYALHDGSRTVTGVATVTVTPVETSAVECDAASVARQGPWKRVADPAAQGGLRCQVEAAAGGSTRPSLSLTFSGDRADVGYLTCPTCGTATVFVDGIRVGSFDERASTSTTRVFRIRHLSPGSHVVKVEADQRPGSSVTVDGFAVAT
ncbi:MAG: DUF4185 domain-containing protein [Frankiaceae bacterium]|nr:DUF4185 domain-containing protein [Frankiaceae bacterium]